MPLNPSIPLGVQQVKMPDQLQTLAQLYAVKGAQQQNALADYQLGQAQQKDARDNALRSAIQGAVGPDGAIDMDKVGAAYAQNGDAAGMLGFQTARSKIAANEATASTQRLERASKTLGFIGQLAQGVTDQRSYDAAKAQMAQVLGPQMLQGMPEIYDPKWVDQQKQSTLSYKDQIDLQLRGKGQAETARHNRADEYIQSQRGPLALTMGPDGSMTAIGGPGGVGGDTVSRLATARRTLKEAEAEGAAGGKRMDSAYGEYLAGGDEARLDNSRLDRLNTLLENVNTGKFAGTTLEFKKGLKALGVDPESFGFRDDVAPQENAKQITGLLTVGATKQAKLTPVSNADMIAMGQLQPGIDQTPQGRKLLIAGRKAENNRAIDLARLAVQYKKQHGALDAGWDELKMDFADKNPIYKPITEGEYAKLKPGDYFFDEQMQLKQKRAQ